MIYLVAATILVIVLFYVWNTSRLERILEAHTQTASMREANMWRLFDRQNDFWVAREKEHDELIRHLLNRIQAPEYAVTEVPASAVSTEDDVTFDEGPEEPNVPNDELSDEELEEEAEGFDIARNHNFEEFRVDPLPPQKPHQPLKVGDVEDGVSGS